MGPFVMYCIVIPVRLPVLSLPLGEIPRFGESHHRENAPDGTGVGHLPGRLL